MTCILATVGKGWAAMAGDRCMSTADDELFTSAEPKIAKIGGVLLGFAGSPDAWSRLIENWGIVPADLQSIRRRVRQISRDHGKSSEDFFERTELMLAIPGLAMCAQEHGVVIPYSDPVLGIGCGKTAGMAAAMSVLDRGPKRALMHGLRTAARLVSGVRGPFDFRSVGLR